MSRILSPNQSSKAISHRKPLILFHPLKRTLFMFSTKHWVTLINACVFSGTITWPELGVPWCRSLGGKQTKSRASVCVCACLCVCVYGWQSICVNDKMDLRLPFSCPCCGCQLSVVSWKSSQVHSLMNPVVILLFMQIDIDSPSTPSGQKSTCEDPVFGY